MTVQEFKTNLSQEQIESLKAICQKNQGLTKEEAQTLYNFIFEQASPAIGEDLIAEPFRYLIASTGGLRSKDLQAMIGDDFDAALFEEFNQILDTPILVQRALPADEQAYDFTSMQLRLFLQELMGKGNYKSCASDIGYYLLEKCPANDMLRAIQCTHLLLDGGETVAAAEYISGAEGEALRLAVTTLGNGLKDGPAEVKQCILDLPLTQSEKVNTLKLFMLLLNDCLGIVGNIELQRPFIEKLTVLADSMVGSHPEIAIVPGVCRLRMAQNSRTKANIFRQQQKADESTVFENEAQQSFLAAINVIMPLMQKTDPATLMPHQVDQFWLCLKICQEMGQPKAMSLIFENIIRLERGKLEAETQKGDASEFGEDEFMALTERMIAQHIDMSKLYYSMPEALQKDFVNYSEATINLIKAYIEGAKEDQTKENDTLTEEQREARQANINNTLIAFYQTLGELNSYLEKWDESYDALTEAQILQMRLLAAIQRTDGEDKMSQKQLVARLGLSVTNHMLAIHYRKQEKAQRDLDVVLNSNLDLALDCFKFYPHEGRVIHFLINAALELGDNHHRNRGYLAECHTYQKVIDRFASLNNLRLDEQLAIDVAMIYTKCGQVQADDAIRQYSDAKKNLEAALNLWNSLAQNTHNPEFKNNADLCSQILGKIKA